MPNATILQPFGFEKYWQMLFYFVAKGKTADNGDKCNKNFCTKRSQILNGHALNICINKTFEKKAKNRMKTAHKTDT